MPVWRIRDRRTFEQLRARGERHRSGPVTVTTLLDDDGHPPRVAFAITKAVGNATVRNQVRRRLRSIAAELALPSGAYVISVGPEAAQLPYARLRDHVVQACGTERG